MTPRCGPATRSPPGVRKRRRRRDPLEHRPADPGAVRDRRLLGLPAGAGPIDAGAGGDDRAAARERRPDPDAADRRAGRPGRRADAAAGDRARDDASAVQVLPRGRRRTVSVIPRRAAGRSRAAARRAGRADARPACFRARRRAACSKRPARSWRRSSARRGRSGCSSRRRTSGCARWPRTSGGAGTTTPRRSSATSIRCCGGSSAHNPVALLQRIDIDELHERASQLVLHSRINYAYRRMQEYLSSTRPGAPARRRAVGAAGRVLLGGVRPARVDPDLLRRPRHPGRRPHQGRLRPRHAAGRHRPVLRPGLLPAAARHDG